MSTYDTHEEAVAAAIDCVHEDGNEALVQVRAQHGVTLIWQLAGQLKVKAGQSRIDSNAEATRLWIVYPRHEGVGLTWTTVDYDGGTGYWKSAPVTTPVGRFRYSIREAVTA